MIFKYSVYVLTEPDGITIRYVGLTTKFKNRLTRHICDARKKPEYNPRMIWLRKLESENKKPCIKLIEETNDYNREKYWIKYYRNIGIDLVNSSSGGESRPGYIMPKKVKDAANKARKGQKISESHRQALIKANTGRKMSEKTKKILLECNHKRKFSATHCKNGHEFTKENTLFYKKLNYRYCKICRKIIKRKHYVKKYLK